MTKLSIIVPVYNVERYLPACLDSIADLPGMDYEVILINDGSTDGSERICQEYADRKKNFKVYSKPNGGLSSARNTGLQHAEGEYIFFLDSDDACDQDALAKVVQIMDQGYDLVSFSYNRIDEEGNHLLRVPNFGYSLIDLINGQNRIFFITNILLPGGLGWEAWGNLFKRSIIENNQLKFEDTKKIFAEDLLFMMNYLLHTARLANTEIPVVQYRKRTDSIMQNAADQIKLKQMLNLAELFSQSLKNQPYGVSPVYLKSLQASIMMNEIVRCIQTGVAPKQLRSAVKSDPALRSYFRENRKYGMNSRTKGMGLAARHDYASLWIYLGNGNYFSYRKRNRTIYTEYGNEKTEYLMFSLVYFVFFAGRKKLYPLDSFDAFYIGCDEFGNLGDHMINESAQEYYRALFPDREYAEITIRYYPVLKKYLQKNIKAHQMLLLGGGGNFGNLYPEAMQVKLDVIQSFPDQKIVGYPQTVYFSESDRENSELLEKTRSILEAHPDLHLFVRDSVSLNYLKNNFHVCVDLVPDIVMSAASEQSTADKQPERENRVLLCFRNDIESAGNLKQMTESLLRQEKIPFTQTTLQLPYNIPGLLRMLYLNEEFRKWRKAALVITDRLHAMIFSYITGTPCIVFNTNNNKTKDYYETWLSEIPWIRYVDDPKMLSAELIESVLSGADGQKRPAGDEDFAVFETALKADNSGTDQTEKQSREQGKVLL